MSRLDGKSPRYLLAVLQQMGRMATVVNGQVECKAHGTRALRRDAKRRRYAANGRRAMRQGYRSHGEWMKRQAALEALGVFIKGGASCS